MQPLVHRPGRRWAVALVAAGLVAALAALATLGATGRGPTGALASTSRVAVDAAATTGHAAGAVKRRSRRAGTRSAFVPSIVWGMNPGAEIADFRFDAADDRGLQAIRDVGTQELRVAAAWRLADPTGDAALGTAAWDWSDLDSVARGAAEHGMRWAPFACYPPPSMSRDSNVVCGGPPTNARAWRRFLTAFARRYGPGGAFWTENPQLPALPVREIEVWNEPNLVTAWPAPKGVDIARKYATFYRWSRTAIRAGNPGVSAMFASLAPVPGGLHGLGGYPWSSFLRRSLGALKGRPVDSFGWHPYITGVTEADPTKHVYTLVRRFRAALRRLGRPDAPMEVTELGVARNYGWMGANSPLPEAKVTLTEAERAAFFTKVVPRLAGSNCGIGSIVPLQFSSDREIWTLPASIDDPLDIARNVATTFSLADSDSVLRPSGEAYKAALARVTRDGVTPNRLCG